MQYYKTKSDFAREFFHATKKSSESESVCESILNDTCSESRIRACVGGDALFSTQDFARSA
ncbi:MAG: hypothetical protein D6747_08730 [Chlorobiota bacterium]|nr:MAG: hypothetical protein D6747_08730 [Chlorobiota bacterium]